LSPARSKDGASRGYIVPIGGAEEKVKDSTILSRFTALCGGRQARIAIISTASEIPETGRQYETVFHGLTADQVWILPFRSRAECEASQEIDKLMQATGVFFTGGNQLRLSTTLGGTAAARTLRRLNADGVHIAGTSAGGAFLPEHMIAGGEEGPTPRSDMVTLAPGLGLTNRIVVDQHFRQRDRLGRLLTALAYNPFSIGLGLDEDTAAFIAPDDTLEVLGSGSMTIVDPQDLEFSSLDSARKGEPVCLIGIRLHVLVGGASFNFRTRQARAGRTPPEKS
jgi:cyanophycinase